jgi:hypothetical protein
MSAYCGQPDIEQTLPNVRSLILSGYSAWFSGGLTQRAVGVFFVPCRGNLPDWEQKV